MEMVFQMFGSAIAGLPYYQIRADLCAQEYDFLTQFWASVTLSPGGPSGRWGAAGGNDQRISYLPTAGLNNSFYLAGGRDGSSISPLSDVWRLNVSGTLSPNNPNQVFGSWESLSVPTLASIQGLAGTVISQQIISSGGCKVTAPANSNNTCAVGDSFIINTSSRSSISPASCPAPRYEGVMVANMNGASTSFNSQTFLLLGTFNSNMWDDAGGLSKGEIVCHTSHEFHFTSTTIILNRRSSTLALGLGPGYYQQVILTLFPRIPALVVVLPPSHTHKL